MKIIIVGKFPFPTGAAASARIRNLALGLSSHQAHVHILSMDPWGSSTCSMQSLTPYVSYEFVSNRRHINFGKENNSLIQKLFWFFEVYRGVIPAYRRLRELIRQQEWDAFLVYGRNAFLFAPLIHLANAHNIITLLDVVEISEQFHGFGGFFSPLYWDIKFGENLLPGLVKGVTIIASELEAVCKKSGSSNLLLLPSIEGWTSPPVALDRPSEAPFQLTYVGGLTTRDAPDILFEALDLVVRKHEKVFLNLIGYYENAPQVHRWRDFVSQRPLLADRVNWIGRVSDSELSDQLSNSDGLILTRRDAYPERCSFPTRLVEYLTYARPVFVSAVGDIPHYLRDGKDAMLLPPGDAQGTAARICQVVSREDRGRAIGEAGWRRGEKFLNRNTRAKELITFIKQLQEVRGP